MSKDLVNASSRRRTRYARQLRCAGAITLSLGGMLGGCGGDSSPAIEQCTWAIEPSAGGTNAAGSSALVAVGAAGVPNGVSPISANARIVEAKIDPPGNDGNYEYIELSGEPGSQLSGYWLLAVEGDSDANMGQIDVAIDLAQCGSGPCEFGRNGLLLLSPEPPAAVGDVAWRKTKELANGRLENGTTTLLLVQGLTGSPLGLDWDTDDNGTLEVEPNVAIRQAIAWTDGTAGDRAYSVTVLGPKPKPQAVWQCPAPEGGELWRWGEISGDSAALTMDVSHFVPEHLAQAELTPGRANDCASADLPDTNTNPNAAAAGSEAGGAASGGIGGAAVGASVPANGCPSSNSPSEPAATPNAGTTASGSAGSESRAQGGTPQTSSNEAPSALLPQSTAALAPCGGTRATTLLVANASPRAGSTGWWSPNPFAATGGSTLAGSLTESSSQAAGLTGTDSSRPRMPGSCGLCRSGRQSSTGAELLAGLAILLLHTRRSRGSTNLESKINHLRKSWLSRPCAEPAIPLYAHPKNVEPSDLERAPTS